MRRAVGLPEREGLLVRAVEEGGPADSAGIERGDLLVAAAGRELTGVDTLYEVLDEVSPGDTIDLTVVRGTDERTVTAQFTTEAAAA